MEPRLHSQRRWEILERFPRALLYRIGRAARVSVANGTRKHDVIETLCALPVAALERALVEGLAREDLQALCKRIGYASTGSKVDLAARLIAAVDETAVHAPRWRSFAAARAFAQRLKLTGAREWRAFARGGLPAKGTLASNIPRYPNQVYARAGWTSWGDFLGTGNVAPYAMTFRPFRQARAYARSLGFANVKEWEAFCRPPPGKRHTRPPDIPANPHHVYADLGWLSYGDWLGTEHVHPSKRQYRSYAEACAFVRALGIRSTLEWRMYCRGDLDGHDPRPRDIPSNPQHTYRGRGWVSWGAFLGTNSVAPSKRTFRSFTAARAYMRKQGLRSIKEWRAWRAAGNRPADIPTAPSAFYRGKGWVSWGDFLGTGNVHPSRIRRRSFAAMRAFVRRLGLSAAREYRRAWRAGRVPKDIPLNIWRHPEWKGWPDFLGPSYTGRAPKAAVPARARRRRG
jgi:hypothetical protein